MLVDGIDHTEEVRGPAVDAAVSAVSAVPEVRAALLARQRSIARDGSIIMAGRDIGTVVLPDADLKLFLDASVEERARRRTEERGLDPAGADAEAILVALRRRDDLDKNRPIAPLRAGRGRPHHLDRRQPLRGHRRRGRQRHPRHGGPPMTELESSITPLIATLALGGRVFARGMSRVHIEGDLAAIPREGPVIIAANHASNFDAVVLGAWLTPALGRRIHWLGKKELFAWPVVGWVARNGGVHPVDRGAADAEAFRLARRILDEGHVLLVFPEGTRSADGALQEATDGVADARPAHRCGDRADRHRGLGPGLAARSEAPASAAAASRCGSVEPFRLADVLPPGTDRKAAKGLRDRRDHAAHRGAPRRRQRGVYATRGRRGRRTGERRLTPAPRMAPCDNRARWEPSQDVRIAKRTGFCYGVREAIDKAKEAARRRQVDAHPRPGRPQRGRRSRDLQALGIETVEALDDVDHGAAVVIRAHGVRPDVHGARRGARPRGHRRHLHLGHPGAARARASSSRRATRSSCSARPTTPRSSACSASRPTRSWSTRRRTGTQRSRGARSMALISQSTQPPWKFEKLAAFMVGAQPRAQDRQHRLPGHDPPPGGHGRAGARGRPDGRRRRPVAARTRRS